MASNRSKEHIDKKTVKAVKMAHESLGKEDFAKAGNNAPAYKEIHTMLKEMAYGERHLKKNYEQQVFDCIIYAAINTTLNDTDDIETSKNYIIVGTDTCYPVFHIEGADIDNLEKKLLAGGLAGFAKYFPKHVEGLHGGKLLYIEFDEAKKFLEDLTTTDSTSTSHLNEKTQHNIKVAAGMMEMLANAKEEIISKVDEEGAETRVTVKDEHVATRVQLSTEIKENAERITDALKACQDRIINSDHKIEALQKKLEAKEKEKANLEKQLHTDKSAKEEAEKRQTELQKLDKSASNGSETTEADRIKTAETAISCGYQPFPDIKPQYESKVVADYHSQSKSTEAVSKVENVCDARSWISDNKAYVSAIVFALISLVAGVTAFALCVKDFSFVGFPRYSSSCMAAFIATSCLAGVGVIGFTVSMLVNGNEWEHPIALTIFSIATAAGSIAWVVACVLNSFSLIPVIIGVTLFVVSFGIVIYLGWLALVDNEIGQIMPVCVVLLAVLFTCFSVASVSGREIYSKNLVENLGYEEVENVGGNQIIYRTLDDGTLAVVVYEYSSEKLIIPAEIDGKTVTRIEARSAEEGGVYLSSNREIVKEIVIPDSVTSIGDAAFYGCSGLTLITIPDSVTSIGDDAFRRCSGVEVVDGIKYVDGWVIGAETGITTASIRQGTRAIADQAFVFHSDLTLITIPDSVTSIGDAAFYGCSGLTSISYNGTKAQWNTISKDSDWNDISAIKKVVCTDGSVLI